MLSRYSSLVSAPRRVSRAALLSLGLALCTLVWSTAAHAEPFAYITNQNSDTVSVLDTATNTVTASVPVGNSPVGVAVRPDGAFAYVTNDFSDTVSVLDTATNTVTATVPVGNVPIGVAVRPDGAFAYVTNQFSATVSVIDTATNTVVASVPVGGDPSGVAVRPDGAFAYVTNRSSDTVSVLDTATNTVTASVPVGDGPIGVAVRPDGAFVYVVNGNSATVSVIDTATNTVTATVGVGITPQGVAVTPDGTRVYVANVVSDTVSVIDTATNTVTATVGVGITPQGVAVTPDGTRVYVANLNSDTVSVIDTATNTVTATVPVGDGPVAFGAFIGPVVCGNGMVGSGEQCDDGNTANGDGCSSSCQVENRPPVAVCQNVTVNACGGVAASIDNGSSDPDGDALTLSQSPAGPYGLGATTVQLTVSDGTLSSTCTGTVTVVDGQAPALSCPANQQVTATSPGGAVVNFSVNATDNCPTLITGCSPPSGSTFPLGSTTVACTATDGAGNQKSCSFTVTVTASATLQLEGLLATVQGLPVPPAVKVALKAPLLVAKVALQKNQPQVACGALRVFEEVVQQLRRANKLTAAQATLLSSASQSIRATLGCP